jgi:hypothetical protein
LQFAACHCSIEQHVLCTACKQQNHTLQLPHIVACAHTAVFDVRHIPLAGGLQRQLHMSVACAAAASGDLTVRIKDDMKVGWCDNMYISMQYSALSTCHWMRMLLDSSSSSSSRAKLPPTLVQFHRMGL